MLRGSGVEVEQIPGLHQERLEKCSFSSAGPSAAINRQRRRVRGILKCYSRGDLPSLFRDTVATFTRARAREGHPAARRGADQRGLDRIRAT